MGREWLVWRTSSESDRDGVLLATCLALVLTIDKLGQLELVERKE